MRSMYSKIKEGVKTRIVHFVIAWMCYIFPEIPIKKKGTISVSFGPLVLKYAFAEHGGSDL